ncbi:hypothetical protein D3C79_1004410 [compost metagenome]
MQHFDHAMGFAADRIMITLGFLPLQYSTGLTVEGDDAGSIQYTSAVRGVRSVVVDLDGHAGVTRTFYQ